MAEKGEKRDPVSHRTPTQIKRMMDNETEEERERRRMRMRARYAAEKKGLVKKGDNKDIDHKKPLSKGGTNDPSNLRVRHESDNRGWRKEKDGPNKPGKRK